jgi:hypothetical protein
MSYGDDITIHLFSLPLLETPEQKFGETVKSQTRKEDKHFCPLDDPHALRPLRLLFNIRYTLNPRAWSIVCPVKAIFAFGFTRPPSEFGALGSMYAVR